jgi:hypothetical protein
LAPVFILSGAGGFIKVLFMQVIEMREMETISFKASPEFTAWLGWCVSDLDMSRSEVVRACIALSLPTLKEHPGLIDILSIEARNGNGYKEDTRNGR